jgi:hypothetical protein
MLVHSAAAAPKRSCARSRHGYRVKRRQRRRSRGGGGARERWRGEGWCVGGGGRGAAQGERCARGEQHGACLEAAGREQAAASAS